MSDKHHGGHPHRSQRGPRKPRDGGGGGRGGGRRGGGPSSGGGKGFKSAGRAEPVPADLPETKFAEFDLAPNLEAGIAAAGYIEPSPIQAGMIPLVLEEKNVVGRAQTGTGKTAAFLIPLLGLLEPVEDAAEDPDASPTGPVRILIVAPTRELAIQIAKESDKLTRFVPVRTVCCYGGTSIDDQVKALRDCMVVAGTPGRLLDLIRRGHLDLGSLDAIVLDEVDRMYDLGFRDDVDRILAAGKSRQQTILTSATLNDDVENLIAKHMGEHERVIMEAKSLTVDAIDQTFYFVDPRRKQDLLIEVLKSLKPAKGIVFVRTRFSVDRITYQLQQRGMGAELIHSGLPQRKRERILELFREGKFPLLIATDVAARGLDIDDITHVVNFDIPNHAEDYVHRVGRTARMGKEGAAVTFVTIDDGPYLTQVEKLINKEIRQEMYPGFELEKPEPAAKKEAKKQKRPPGLPPWANVARRR
ncbi:MAG: DEAD/DEAH box helicase [Planctomycetota bacterium]|nr:DEAD/DEAH box helicase [Planctomycetota bacterium]